MNERIKQCWLTAARQDSGDKWDSQEEFIERFAQLIVRECMDIAREVGTSTEPEDFALDRCYEIETKIKQHFGVER